MTEQELKEKYNMFTDSWKFYRKWAVMEFPLPDEQWEQIVKEAHEIRDCLLYTSPSPRDRTRSRMPSSA